MALTDPPNGGAESIFRDLTSGLVHQPEKAEVREWGAWVETGLSQTADLGDDLLALASAGDPVRLSYVSGSGQSATYEVVAAQAALTLSVGQPLQFAWQGANTGVDPTLTIGATAYTMRAADGAALAADDLRASSYLGRIHTVTPAVIRVLTLTRIADVPGLEDTIGDLEAADAANQMDAAEALNEALDATAAAAVADGKAVVADGKATTAQAAVDAEVIARASGDVAVQMIAQTVETVAQEFNASDDDPASVVADGSGAPVDQIDMQGFRSNPMRAEFHGSDDDILSGTMTPRGDVIGVFDDQGFPVLPLRAEFHASDDDLEPGVYEVDMAGVALRRIDQALSPLPLTAYASGGTIRVVGADDQAAAPLGSLTALAPAGGATTHARMLVADPQLGPARVVAVMPGEPWMVPCHPGVMYLILGLGQSLMLGSSGLAIDAAYGPTGDVRGVVVFKHADGRTDIRGGVNGSYPTLDPAKLIGFDLLTMPEVAETGQSPLESMALRLGRFCVQRRIEWNALAYVTALGGTGYADLKKGSETYSNMLAGVTQAKALAEAQGMKLVVLGAALKHGEADAGDPDYGDYLLEWQSDVETDVQAITGQDSPVPFVYTQSSSFVSNPPEAALAFLDLHNSSDRHNLVGPDYALIDEYNATDLIHLDGIGSYHIGEYLMLGALRALWHSAKKSRPLKILSAVRVGTTVTLTYDVPVPPLVLDDGPQGARVGEVRGFRFYDSTGQITINAVAVASDTTITLTLAATPSGTSERVDYALMPQTFPRTAGFGPRGSVRDSSTEVSDHDARPLQNWAVHQRITL